ncbi:OmpA family protein [Desulfovibrio sp. OttesenSCG-928-F07]|nr:OmpA family protein [Desulfovibrio sp. OttesenSCG-928-F07]
MNRGKRVFPSGGVSWVVTFADLMTLLLALFVLIFSMSSLDSSTIRSISSGLSREKFIDGKRGDIPANIKLAADIMADLQNAHPYTGELEKLLFPRELLPPAVDKGTLSDIVKIQARKDGMAFVLAEEVLFVKDTSRISPEGRVMLELLAPLFNVVQGEIAISGHTKVNGRDPYEVTTRNAVAVLGVFLNCGLQPARFAISGYGADKPLPAGAETNNPMYSRVEILVKTRQ